MSLVCSSEFTVPFLPVVPANLLSHRVICKHIEGGTLPTSKFALEPPSPWPDCVDDCLSLAWSLALVLCLSVR